MDRQHKYFFYRKVFSWALYITGGVAALFLIYLIVNSFFEYTFDSSKTNYESFKMQYTSTPGSDPTLVDKNKWKKDKKDTSWNSPIFYKDFVHPLVAFTIAFVLVIAIIGGIVVLRHTQKNDMHR